MDVAGHNDRPKNFVLCKVLFLNGQNTGEKLTKPCIIFHLWTWFFFLQLRQNPRFTGVDLAVRSKMRVYATSEHDDLCVNFLANQVTILARYCPFSLLAVILSSGSLFIKQFFQQFFLMIRLVVPYQDV